MLKALYLEFLPPIETFHFLSQSHFVDVISFVFKNAKYTYKQEAIVADRAMESLIVNTCYLFLNSKIQ